jgi:acyl-CoA thioester hydrolase
LNESSPTAIPPYRAQLLPEWIDFNGHLRDAYYGLVMSYAIDDIMDHLGLDAGYRERTRCTLYTLELHMRYMHEVKGTDDLLVATSILDADRKRIHMGCRFICGGLSEAVATGEVMLLHVHQGDKPASAPFPREIDDRIQKLRLPSDAGAAWGPGSQKMQLQRRAAASAGAANS